MSLLFRGQQLAQQMQTANPELVSQLREQMGRPGSNPPGENDGSDPSGEQQPPKPGTLKF